MAGLSDLKRLKKQIDAAAAQAKAEKAAATLAAKRQAAARNLFQAAMGKVQPLPPTDLADLKPSPPAPQPLLSLGALASGITFGRLIAPDEVAETIRFCALNPIINGSVIHANLGQVER